MLIPISCTFLNLGYILLGKPNILSVDFTKNIPRWRKINLPGLFSSISKKVHTYPHYSETGGPPDHTCKNSDVKPSLHLVPWQPFNPKLLSTDWLCVYPRPTMLQLFLTDTVTAVGNPLGPFCRNNALATLWPRSQGNAGSLFND